MNDPIFYLLKLKEEAYVLRSPQVTLTFLLLRQTPNNLKVRLVLFHKDLKNAFSTIYPDLVTKSG